MERIGKKHVSAKTKRYPEGIDVTNREGGGEQSLMELPSGIHDWFEGIGRRSVDLSCPEVNEDAVRNLLSVSISALVNTTGGLVILGIAMASDGRWAVDDGGLVCSSRLPSLKGWLEKQIPYLVDPWLYVFDVSATTVAESLVNGSVKGKAVYVIRVPESERAPHQAIDHRYYGRRGGISLPLCHRDVIDIFENRQRCMRGGIVGPGFYNL